jgi:polyphosphate kinase
MKNLSNLPSKKTTFTFRDSTCMIVNNYRNKEISWLSFNERLLQEAEKTEVPVIERIKFLGIYSNNLNEFFRVRVAFLKRIAELNNNRMLDGGYPLEILKEIQRLIIKQQRRFNTIYSELLKELAQHDIFLINEKELSAEQGEYVQKYFYEKVRPSLQPVLISKSRDLPDLKNDAIYFAIELISKKDEKVVHALMEIPSSIKRFILLPSEGKKKYIILLDDVIRFELKDIFYMFEPDETNAYTVKLTRDAELNIDDDLAQSYVDKITQSLEKRKDAPAVRLVHDKEIPEDFLKLLMKKIHFTRGDAIIMGGRYHNFKDFMNFPKIGPKSFHYPEVTPIKHKDLEKSKSVLSKIKEKDILLHFPYHSFSNFIDLLQEASIDPNVVQIKLTIYRVAKNSKVINTLINAARNGKKVTAILELQARFDEEANIKWSNKLKAAGVKVIYGVHGLKVHSKLCLIVRKEKRQLINYACIGTGNFNEDTAKVFSDHLLLTVHLGITKEVAGIFNFFDKNYNKSRNSHLLVSPFSLRTKLNQLIQNEINNAKAGKKSFVYLKLNNLVDITLINKLYRAKKMGVDVKLNIRGMFSLVPKFDKLSNTIPAIGLIDRYLEHTRIYMFGNNGDTKIYLSSADLMTRNLDRRIEVACPVYDEELKEEIIQLCNLQWQDNSSARILDNSLSNKIKPQDKKEIRSQTEFYNYLSQKQNK